jgi:alpha-L-rhamnosidase
MGESYLFDNQRLYSKWMTDIRSAMSPLGQLPDAAPVENYTYSDNVVSAAAYFLVPRMLYRQFADLNVVKDHYPSMKKWMAYMEKRYLKKGLLEGVASIDKGVPPLLIGALAETNPDRLTDGNLIANAYYIKLLQVMHEFAGMLGNSDDQKRFLDKEVVMRKAFQSRFFHVNAYYYANNTVTANVLPLAFGITPEEDRKAVFNHICRVIEEVNAFQLSTGEVGTAWLLQTLSAYGRTDLALRLATNRGYPGWGYMMERGATTLWESWNADKMKGNQVSINHMALMGDVLNWCYENIAGISCAPDGPGFKKIILKPEFVDGITNVESSLFSPHGWIVSQWSREGIHLNWNITVPPNTVALMYIPAPQAQVMESGKPVSLASGVSFVKTEGVRSIFELKSGTYSFEVKR